MSQLYSFKAVEDSFQQPNNNASDDFMSQLYSFKAVEDSFPATKWYFRDDFPSFIPSKAVEDSFSNQIIMLQRRLHVPALFLQGCRRFFQQPNNNASETTSCPSFYSFKGCRRFFQQPNGNASETTSSQLYSFKAVEDSFQQPNNNASETTSCPSFIPSRL
ncbi:unnamed protein product [Acanthosepion pharaonis]|uniref:Uncharacterized protein n=1 Tax=Acanthosepion pharaonis TaxID=158019 RepID=A0A812C5D6_ACAPH|nr:unnamed protein product [Sepia pharaonis]